MRDVFAAVRRVVVKVGTTSVTDAGGALDPARVDAFVGELCEVQDTGREVVCVTSGAVAAGLAPLGLTKRPKDMPTLQAAAAVGQTHLMDVYATAFEARGRVCGQVLVTRADFVHRQRYVNALNTFARLMALGCVPVVNENDSVATEEIRFGENDLLAALVANLVKADALLLLSDVDGLHLDGAAEPVAEVEAIDEAVERSSGASASGLGSGGMRSKIAAAKIATRCGVPVVIARAGAGTVRRVLAGEQVGTSFRPSEERLTARKAWIAYATEPRGTITVDDGARRALIDGGRSLLAAGVKGVDGSFVPGDAVDIALPDASAFARGLVGFSSDELARVAGMDSARISELTGGTREVVHRDELVVL